MKQFDGYKKLNIGDTYVLLAGGGHESLNTIKGVFNTLAPFTDPNFYWYRIKRPTNFAVYEIIIFGDKNYPFHGRYTLTMSSYYSYSHSFCLLDHGRKSDSYNNLYIAADIDYVYIQGQLKWECGLNIRCIKGTDRIDSQFKIASEAGVASGFTPITPIYKNSICIKIDRSNNTYSGDSIPVMKINIEGDADTLDGKHASAFSLTGHDHDTIYSKLGHNHDNSYLKLIGGTVSGNTTFLSRVYLTGANKLLWDINDNDTNSTGANWYGIGTYNVNEDNTSRPYISFSNYWGINLIAKDNNHIFINGNIVYHQGNLTTFSGSGLSHSGGLVPDPGSIEGTTKFLREDGNWSTPTYPTVNNGTLTLLASGTAVTTFTANLSGNSTFNITSGSSNGTLSIGGINVSVAGLGSAAYESSDSFFKSNRYTIENSYIDLTNYNSGDSNYQNLHSGTYTIARPGYSELLIVFRGSGSTSALELMTSYNDSATLYYRKTIDANRISGLWRYFITDANIGSQSVNYAATAGDADTLDGHDSTYFSVDGHAHDGRYWKQLASVTTFDWNSLVNPGWIKILAGNITNHPKIDSNTNEYLYGMASIIIEDPSGSGNESRVLLNYYPHSLSSDIVMWSRMKNGSSWNNWRAVPSIDWVKGLVYSKSQSDGKYVTQVAVTDDTTNHFGLLRYVINGVSSYFTVPYATNSDTLDGYHASDIGKAGWVDLGGQQTKSYYKMCTMKCFETWQAIFEIDATGDWNYANYAHARLILQCYNSSSCSVTLLGGPEYVETLYAYIDSNLNIWIAHDRLYASHLRWKCIYGSFNSNHLILYTSSITTLTSEPSSYKITSNGAYHYVKSGSSFSYNSTMYDNTSNTAYPVLRNVDLVGNADSATYATTAGSANSVAWTNVTGKTDYTTRWPSWSEVTDKPDSFTPSTHSHGLTNSNFFRNLPSTSGNLTWKEAFGYNPDGALLMSVRINNPAPSWCVGNYGSGILYGGGDTKGFMSSAYGSPYIMWAGGNGITDSATPVWTMSISGADGGSYNLANFLTSQDHYKTSITAGTAGTSSDTDGLSLSIPYVTMNADGHVTGYGTHTHTIPDKTAFTSVNTHASYNPNKYYWYKINYPSSVAMATYEIIVTDDYNYPRSSRYNLQISNYSNSGYCAILTHLGGTVDLYIASNTEGVYIQGIACLSSNLRIRCIDGVNGFISTSVGNNTEGIAAGFTPTSTIYKNTCAIRNSSSGVSHIYTPTIYSDLNGNASTASTWKTSRTITIGNTGKSLDGSADVSWSLEDIGAIGSVSGTLWGQSFTNGGTINGAMTFGTLAMATGYVDAWSDGTHTHPWYGYDHRYENTGVYSTTITDYFGLTLRTGSGNISMTSGGDVGIGTYAPGYKLEVNGNVKASGFVKNNSSSSKVLLGDGTDKDLVNLQITGTASSLTSLDITKTFIYVTLSANVAASAFTLSSTMSTGQCLTILVYNNGSATISITVPSSWKSLDGYNLTCGATKFLEISIVKYASGANDYILSSKAQ